MIKGYIVQGDSLLEVHSSDDLSDINPPKEGRYYEYMDMVYPYRGKYFMGNILPGLYIAEESKLLAVEYVGKLDLDMWSALRIMTLDPENIKKALVEGKENFIATEEEQEFIKANSVIYSASITEEDDFLKMIIKTAINIKKIDLKDYRDKFPDSYVLNNMKSSLEKKTKMSVHVFQKWCEILGLEWTISVKDNKAVEDNLIDSIIVIESENGNIVNVRNKP